MSRQISITEALNELKLYDSKITKAISGCECVGAAKKSSDKVGLMLKSNFVDRAKSGYQSVTDLIANRNKIKSAIVQSNAVTMIEVAGVPMTVAAAIERKSSIEYDKNLLYSLKRQLAAASSTVLKENTRVDTQVDKMLETFMGKDSDKRPSKEDQAAIVEPYREKNEWELVDPLDITKVIEELETGIDAFEAEVDTRLAVCNAVTMITLDF